MLTSWGLGPQEVMLFGKFWKLQEDVCSWLKEIVEGRALGGILFLVAAPFRLFMVK